MQKVKFSAFGDDNPLMQEFRQSRGQTQEPPAPEPSGSKKTFIPKGKSRSTSSYYDSFYAKYTDLENSIDHLNTRDLVYFLREMAEENGFRYTISNIKKDMAIMKRLKESYTVREICGMIEFLYTSEQDYLDKTRITPNLLASQWINTIYADMQLWVDDKYVPRSQRTRASTSVQTKEWDTKQSGGTKVGVKL